jgi:hypothetical protein
VNYLDSNGTDPAVKGNNIESLLKPEGGSMPLMMGLSLLSPKPFRSHEPFDVFDAEDANMSRITARKNFPGPEYASDLWTPQLSKVDRLPEEATEDEKREAVKGQYKEVIDMWESPVWKVDETTRFVEEWADLFGWDAKLSQSARLPDKLKKGFNDLYVAAPVITKPTGPEAPVIIAS